jgi:hypothetical protein
MRMLLVLAFAACNVPATRFTPLDDGGGGGGGDDGPPATPAMLVASPSGDIALGTVILGQTSATTTIGVANTGDLDSGPLAVTFDDGTLGFAISADTCTGSSLPGHQTCSFAVAFSPITAIAAQTILHVTADPGGDVMKSVLGTGLLQGQIDITDASYAFGNLGLGAAAATKVFTIRNTGQSDVGAPMPSATGDASYSVMSTTCNAPLHQTDTCAVTVAFAPGSVGGKAGSLVVMSSPGGSDAASLSGVGMAHVSVTLPGSGVGTVTSIPAGISCPGTCDADFTTTPVTLQAAPGTESTFGGWGNACTGLMGCNLDLTAARSVSASFIINQYPVTAMISANNPGTNRIQSSPPGIDCDGMNGCTASFPFGSQVTLTAVPDPVTGRLTSWLGTPCGVAGSNTNPSCTFTVPSGSTTGHALFDWWGSMSIRTNAGLDGFPPARTQVVSNDGSINCTNTSTNPPSGACFAHFGRNAQVTLTYSGSPSTVWTTCFGGINNKFMDGFGSGDCAPPFVQICSSSGGCASSETCTYTFTSPVDATSEYDVACEQ